MDYTQWTPKHVRMLTECKRTLKKFNTCTCINNDREHRRGVILTKG